MRRGGLMVVLILALVSPPSLTAQATVSTVRVGTSSASEATTLQGDAAHDGFSTDQTIAPPLVRRWTVQLGDAVAPSYPIVAGGRAFEIVRTSNGTDLLAFSAVTGGLLWGPVLLGGTQCLAKAAYDNGAVFVLDDSGRLRSFDASTGAAGWTVQIPTSSTGSAPVATGGTVYFIAGGQNNGLYALTEASGALLWRTLVDGGDTTAPAVTGTGVYVSGYAGTYDINPSDGSVLWYTGNSGGYETPVYHAGRVYARTNVPEGGRILDAQTGAVLGGFPYGPTPAFDGSMGFYLNGSTLQGVDLATGSVVWEFTGNGKLVSAPVIANGYVYEASTDGTVYGLREGDGLRVWKARADHAIAGQFGYLGGEQAGNAVAEGTLYVQTTGSLEAFGPNPSPGAVIRTISTAQGPPGGGTRIVLRGRGFTAAKSVVFGGTPAMSFRVVSDRALVAISPPHPAGAVHIQVVKAAGPSVETYGDAFVFFTPDVPVPDVAVTYQMNREHTGAQFGDSLTVSPGSPLTTMWSRDLGGPVSYPLIAGGRVFVTVAPAQGSPSLYALDQSTGLTLWGPVGGSSTMGVGSAAYDSGRVFLLRNDSLVAYDAATGVPLWTTTLINTYINAPPVATGGRVYVAISGAISAYDEATGALVWEAGVNGGGGWDGSPAVTDHGVFGTYACGQAYDFDPASGATIWHHNAWCSGGGGSTSPVHNGRVWMREHYDTPLTLDAVSGTEIGTLPDGAIPTLDGNLGFFVNGSLSAIDLSTRALRWTFDGGGQQITVAPIVDNGVVYVGSTAGDVYALSETAGNVLWHANAGAPILDAGGGSIPAHVGLAAAAGTLVVPASHLLVAYGQ